MFRTIRRFIPNWMVNRLWHWPQAVMANVIYGFPSRKLKMIGVTGTKGKTSVAHLIYHILKEAGNKTVLISTICAKFGDREIDTGLHVTNPDPFRLQKLLKRAVDEGFEYVVMEVTSNGLDQFRDWGIRFELGVFTQITSDHLDYHGSLENYRRAKAKLIGMSKKILINKDDPAREYLMKVCARHGNLLAADRPFHGAFLPPSLNSDAPERLLASQICDFAHTYSTDKFIEYSGKKDDFVSQNEAAAIAAALEMGLSEKVIKNYLKTFPGVPGRMEAIQEKPFKVIIDFAHTPDSLRAVLKQLRKNMLPGKKLIAVFGCAGERDHGRREMGTVAAELADFFIITAEDPRSESVEKISSEIAGFALASGAIEGSHPSIGKVGFVKIPDRKKSIERAIKTARNGDVIGLFGKGHEKSMCYGKTERPWSEHEAVKQILESGR